MSLRYCCLFIVFFVLDAYGQVTGSVGSADTTVALPEIQINATRYRFEATDIPARVHTLDRSALEAAAARNLSEALDRTSSVHLRRYGTGLATASIRGASSSQSLILLDGMPLTDPQLGQVDLSLVPAALLESVAVMHGPGSSLFGANGVGGVINLTSRSHDTHPRYGVFQGIAGPFGERTIEALLGGRGRRIKGIVAGQYGEETGDFPYVHPSLLPQTTVRRVGADRAYWTLFGKVDRLSERAQTSIGVWLTRFERGLPGSTAFPPRDERQWDDFTRISAQHFMLLPQGSVMLRGNTQFSALRYKNPFLQIDDTGRTTSASGEILYSMALGSRAHTRIGLESALRRASHPSLSSRAKEVQVSGYVLTDISLNRVRVFPSVRLDRFDLPEKTHMAALSPALGINVNPAFLSSLYIKARVGKAFRSPTFNDRFWQPGGNPDLRPETSVGYEGGMVWHPPAASGWLLFHTEVTGYHQRVEDQISWMPTENGYWAPFNVDRVISKGLESSLRLEARLDKHAALRTEVFYTITDSRNRSDPEAESYNEQLRYTPKYGLKLITGASRRIGKAEIALEVFARRTGERAITTDGLSVLPAYWTGDVHFKTAWTSRGVQLSLRFLLENVFDQSYEVIKGYPVPPRLLRVQLGIRFPGH